MLSRDATMEREISARVFRTIVQYAESVGDTHVVAELLEAAGVPEDELLDETAWFSTEIAVRVLDRLVELLGPDAPFSAGRLGTASGGLGTLDTAVRAFLEPGSVFRRMSWLISRVSRVGVMEVTSAHARQIVLTFRYAEGTRGSKAMCLHRQGVMAGVPMIWGLAPATVEEEECVHEGGSRCRYRVRWRRLPVARYSRVFVLTTGVVASVTIGLFAAFGVQELGWPIVACVELVAIGALLGVNLDTAFRAGQQQGVIRRQHHALSAQIVQMEGIKANLEDIVAARTEELQHEFRRLARLARWTRALGECLTIVDVLKTMFNGIGELLGATGSSFVLREAGARGLALDGGSWDPGAFGIRTYAENAVWVYTWGEVPNDVGAELAAFWPHKARLQIEPSPRGEPALMRVRVESGGVARGVLSIWRAGERGEFSSRDVDTARTFADALAAALSTVGLLLEKERQATVDPRTELFVYRHFRKLLEIEVERARRYGQPLTLVFIDLDDFKRINDTWGHSAGDEVLKNIGRSIRATVRATDVPARFGGDEFAVLLPGVDRAQGRAMAERLRRTILEHPAEFRGESLPVTVSIGIGEYVNGDDAQTVIDRADRALYDAKDSGKDTIRIHGEGAPARAARARAGG